MGDPIPPTPPVWGTCPDCCNDLPDTIPGFFDHHIDGLYTGSVSQDPLVPCHFEGLFLKGAVPIAISLWFCTAPGDRAIADAEKFGIPFGESGDWPNNDCQPNLSYTGPIFGDVWSFG